MDVKTMTVDEIEARKADILTEIDKDGADLDALESEMRSLKEELEARAAAEAKKAEIRAAVASGSGNVKESPAMDEMKNPVEVRNSADYVEAFAKYVKSGNDRECRALLTETVSGTVPVPAFVEEIIRTAWDNEPILSRVRRANIRGNLKVAFERSADPAYVHTEGTTAVTEESLVLGIVTMIPRNIKKWITISDEALAMGGEAFLRYVYDELAYQITKELAKLVVLDIAGANTTHGATAVGVPKVTLAPAITTIPTAVANLSDEATNLCVIMNRLTEVEFLSAYAAGNFAVDPFAGLTKLYSNALPAYSTADSNAVYAIVGDLQGETVNFPEGEGIVTKFDDLSLAEKDMVKVVGREYAAHAVTAPGRFANIAKPAAATT